jgi:hypothetical protein
MKTKQDILNLETIDKFKESLYSALTKNTLVISSNIENEDIAVELTSKDSVLEVFINNETKTMSNSEFENNFLNYLYNDTKSNLIVLSLKQTYKK